MNWGLLIACGSCIAIWGVLAAAIWLFGFWALLVALSIVFVIAWVVLIAAGLYSWGWGP